MIDTKSYEVLHIPANEDGLEWNRYVRIEWVVRVDSIGAEHVFFDEEEARQFGAAVGQDVVQRITHVHGSALR